jgi:hypothetical protein
MIKVCIQVLRPTVYSLGGNDYLLEPGKYSAKLDRNGILECRKRGFAGGACFIPKSGSFVFVDASKELVDLWECRTALVKAQGEYEAAWRKFQTISS